MTIIRTRIAPSPTGPQLHIGNFRTALYSYFWAKKNQGEFILRVEDTDRKRYVKGSVEGYLKLFKDFGLNLDKAPSSEDIRVMDGPEFPKSDWVKTPEIWKAVKDEDYTSKYIQTQRLPLYLKYAITLLEKGYAYLCFLSESELLEAKAAQPKYQPFRSPHRFLSKPEIENLVNEGKPYVVRLNVEAFIKLKGNNIVEYQDLVLGKMKFDLTTVDDQVLVKANGIPTYHLAVVVDDHNMDITYPIRGYGWLPSTPKQIMLYDMLGWQMPPFAHVTDVLDPQGGKLSKRKGAVFTSEFLKSGYLTDAIINFITLVGWTPKIARNSGEKERELFSVKEIIELFDIEGISKTNAIFDRAKLLWFNQQYIKNKPAIELATIFKHWLKEYQTDCAYCNQIIADEALDLKIKLTQERAGTLLEILQMLEFFFIAPNTVDLKIKQTDSFYSKISDMLVDIIEVINNIPEVASNWDQFAWVESMRNINTKFELKGGDSFMLLRLAVVGQPFSPPLFEAMQILGKKELLNRLEKLA